MILLTGYTSHIADIAEICLPSKQKYAERWEMEFQCLRDIDFPKIGGHPSFQKMFWIRHFLGSGRNVLWLDADSLITNQEINPELFPPGERAIMTASRDYGGFDRATDKTWSAGNCLWTPRAMGWLKQAMGRTEFANSGLWDQDALQATQRDDDVYILPPRKLNAVHPDFGLPASWQAGDFLIHFTGIPLNERAKAAREFIEKYGA